MSEQHARQSASDGPSAGALPVLVELVLMSVKDATLHVLLHPRREAPYQGCYSLPRAAVDLERGEDLPEAAARLLAAETGDAVAPTALHQIGAFAERARDPRGRELAVAWLALTPMSALPSPRDHGAWASLKQLPSMAFRNDAVITSARKLLRHRVDSTALIFDLVPESFTVGELGAAQEAALGLPYDAANFRRRFRRMLESGLLEPAAGRRPTRSKPAKVYRYCGPRP